MSQLINHTISIRLKPQLAQFRPGPGWAVLAAFIAAGSLQFETDFWIVNQSLLIKLAFFWLLADPIIGSVWQLLVEQGLGRTLKQTLQTNPPPVHRALPYTTRQSASYRLAQAGTLLRAQTDGAWQSVLLLTIIAAAISVATGKAAVIYTLISITGAILIGRLPLPANNAWAEFWASMALFLLPYITGLYLFAATVEQNALLLGAGFWVAYLGLLRLQAGRLTAERPLVFGQLVAAMLLFALVKPIAGGIVLLCALFTVLNFTKPNQALPRRIAEIAPLVLLGLLVAAIALGGWL